MFTNYNERYVVSLFPQRIRLHSAETTSTEHKSKETAIKKFFTTMLRTKAFSFRLYSKD